MTYCARSVLICLLVAAPPVCAAELQGVLHGASYHLTRHDADGRSWNESNFGAGVRLGGDTWGVQAGAYRNSVRRVSRYVIGEWTPMSALGARVGAFAGAVDRYRAHGGRPIPAAGLLARWVTPRFAVALRGVPPGTGKAPGVLAVEIGVRFTKEEP